MNTLNKLLSTGVALLALGNNANADELTLDSNWLHQQIIEQTQTLMVEIELPATFVNAKVQLEQMASTQRRDDEIDNGLSPLNKQDLIATAE